MTYRIELQKPYGTLVAAWEAPSARQAMRRWLQAMRQGGPGAFVPIVCNGKEIPPAELRRAK